MVPVRGDCAGIIVEFPHERAVRVPIRSVQRQVPGDFIGEPGIRLFHSSHGGRGVGVISRLSLFKIAPLLDPNSKALRGWPVHAMAFGEPDSFNGDGLTDTIRKYSRIA